jgi:uncharacterized repeat protein (TIGR03803 family)
MMRRYCNIVLGFVLSALISVVSDHRTQAGPVSVLYSFKGASAGDGANPNSTLVMGDDGSLYGTTAAGGAFDMGTVFRLKPNGREVVLHSFTGGDDGGLPRGDLIFFEGGLYGTTAGGGEHHFFGTVFVEDREGGEPLVLHAFEGGADGANPIGGVIMDAHENLYGTTLRGGDFDCGTVFELTTTKIPLHSFTCGRDGANPVSSLIMDPKGNLYGTAEAGGVDTFGTVFKVIPSVPKTIVLHPFRGGRRGFSPGSPLLFGVGGTLTGTTVAGGAGSAGTVFQLKLSDRTLKILYSFTGGKDGGTPVGGLAVDQEGTLFGTTSLGGARFAGTVFKLEQGKLTTLHAFSGLSDGGTPLAGLTPSPAGLLYGTTSTGGAHGKGAVFAVGAQ